MPFQLVSSATEIDRGEALVLVGSGQVRNAPDSNALTMPAPDYDCRCVTSRSLAGAPEQTHRDLMAIQEARDTGVMAGLKIIWICFCAAET